MAALMVHTHRSPRALVSLPWLVVAAVAGILSGPLQARDFADSVVRIRAVAADGSQSRGSGVVIAANLVATACHVTREAKSIDVSRGTSRWAASVESGSAAHDLCLVSVANLDLPAVAIRRSEALKIGERDIAAGFLGGGELAVRDGMVEGLYPYDIGKGIRTTATIDTRSISRGLFYVVRELVSLLPVQSRS